MKVSKTSEGPRGKIYKICLKKDASFMSV